ncbi:hypothetical protein Hanom_Chr14g01298371 [Helianthus anomalus]
MIIDRRCDQSLLDLICGIWKQSFLSATINSSFEHFLQIVLKLEPHVSQLLRRKGNYRYILVDPHKPTKTYKSPHQLQHQFVSQAYYLYHTSYYYLIYR